MRTHITFVSLLLIFSLNTAKAQYCISAYSSGCVVGDQIENVSTTGGITNISNLNSGCSSGSNIYYPNQVVTIIEETSFNFMVQAGSAYQQGFRIWVDWNNDGDFMDAGENVWNSVTWTTTPFNGTITAPAGAVLNTNLRMRVRCSFVAVPTDPCASQSYGETEDYNIFLIPGTKDNDVALHRIVSPGNPVCPGNSPDVIVRIQNAGLKDLDSCYIHWQCRRPSEPIPFPMVNFKYTGNLLPNQISSDINLGFLQGGFQINDTLTIYTTLPNGVPDSTLENDTIILIFRGGISGTFTIGDTLNGQNDFYNFAHAADFVNAAGGVCDSLIFLASDSVFNEQITFTKILGTSTSRPVIFKPKPTNTNPVVLTHTATGAANNYTIRFQDKADYIYFKDIEIKNEGNTFGTVIRFAGNNEGAHFINCKIESTPTTNISANKALVISTPAFVNSNATFINNSFINGSVAVIFEGTDFSLVESGNTFIENKFIDQYNKAAHFNYQTNLFFSKNHIKSTSSYNPAEAAFLNSAGIYLRNLVGTNRVSENTIIPFYYFPIYGIVLDNVNSNPTSKTLIANNWISVGQSFSLKAHAGVYSKNSVHSIIANNNFYSLGFGTENAIIKIEDGSSMEIFNNNLVHEGIGPAISTNSIFNIQHSDYNNFNVNGNVGFFNNASVSNLAVWKSQSGYDLNSKSVDPLYHNKPEDLHVCNTNLKNAGIAIAGLTTDWDGDIRNTTNPDIGADEFTPVSTFSLGNDFGLCVGDSVELKVTLTTGDIAIWSTGDTAESIWVYGPGNPSIMLLNNCGFKRDTITIGQVPHITIPNDTNLCANDTYTFNLSGYSAYQWSNGNTSNSITLSQPGTYVVTATDVYGCKSNDAITITKSGLVRINTDIPNNVLCNNFFGNIEAILPNASYSWNTGSTNKIITINNAGTYHVTANDKGCISHDTIVITSSVRPKADFNFTTSYLTVDIINKSTPGNLGSISWDFGDGKSSNLKDVKNVYSSSGVYTVKLVVSNVCGKDSITKDVYVEVLNIEELEQSTNVTIYPNPASDNINVKLEGNLNDTFLISIIDINGKRVLDKNLQINSSQNLIDINVSNLESGIYFISLLNQTNSIFTNHKLVILK